ncbi:MAG TPA: BON domain-containing protein [Gemmataceae bacterium]|nr:BON domain-containing protein [Gemmataceae bacterium]
MGNRKKEKGSVRWVFCLLPFAFCLLQGCNRQDTDRLARVGRRLVAKTAALAGDLRDNLNGTGWQGFCATWEHAGLEARVAARLRWDKDLTGAAVSVQASGAAMELKGTVLDLAQRRRAVELAERTAGVEKVTDALRIAGP